MFEISPYGWKKPAKVVTDRIGAGRSARKSSQWGLTFGSSTAGASTWTGFGLVIFLVKLRRLGSLQPGARAGTASSPAGRVRIWGGTYFPATNMVDEMFSVFLEIRKTAWFLLIVLSLSKLFGLSLLASNFLGTFLGIITTWILLTWRLEVQLELENDRID